MSLIYSPATGISERKQFLFNCKSLLKDFPIQKSYDYREKEAIVYYNIPAALDIETTSFSVNGEKRAIMYHWQFGIWNMVTTGRTWDELIDFLEIVIILFSLGKKRRLVIYIHNFAYEFQWMRKRFPWDKVFIPEKRKPLYALYSGLEFRDMLKLAGGRSLRNVAKDLQKYKAYKQVGDLDYKVLRTPLTPMKEKELGYCEDDIRVCLYYIQEKIEQDGGIVNIPLTNTGYVRKYCMKECRKNWSYYRALMERLTIDEEEYHQLKRAFQGGFTHANAYHALQLLENVDSYDMTSAYPFVMLLEQFPMSKATKIERPMTSEEFEMHLRTHCCMFDLELFEVSPVLLQDHPISSSKCFKKSIINGVFDNGRVVTADHLKITVTEIDYKIYSKFYAWKTEKISNFRWYEKGPLPKEFRSAILDLYRKKTTLKGIEGMEVEYMISKNMINAGYGMCVMDPVREIFDYVDDQYLEQRSDVSSSLEIYNNKKNRFLFYPWGVWITAYTRRNLFAAIIDAGEDYVYADTDSVKILHGDRHRDFFSKANSRIETRIKSVAKESSHNVNDYMPKNAKGKVCPIGVWDYEGTYTHFKTLGAKRYLVDHDGEFTLTVAGTNKEMSCKYLVDTGNPYGNFRDGLKIPSSATGKSILSYIDEETSGVLVDCNGVPYEYHELSSIHMEDAEYTIGIEKYQEFIDYILGVEDFGY